MNPRKIIDNKKETSKKNPEANFIFFKLGVQQSDKLYLYERLSLNELQERNILLFTPPEN